MKKELVDYIGFLLFGNENAVKQLQLKSEKQFRVNRDGSLEKEQSVITDIIVGKEAIYLNYRLPDGNTVSFVNAITEVDYQVNNDYTIGSIIYKTKASNRKLYKEGEEDDLFILRCEDNAIQLLGGKAGINTSAAGRICYEITG